MRLVIQDAGRSGAGMGLPGLFEFDQVAVRIMTVEEVPIGLDTGGNEIVAGFPEDGVPFFTIVP